MATESRPPAWDHSVHLGTALDYREALASGRWLDMLIARPRAGHPPYPPLYHYSLMLILGSDQPQVAAAGLNLAYLFILIFSCAWIAFQLGGPLPATAAMLSVGLSGAIVGFHREVFPDLAMAAFVTLCYALILRSDRFENRRWALAAGLCAALAMLSKWSAFVYLVPGAAVGLADARRRRNLLGASAVGALLCAPWYVINIFSVIPRVWNSMNMGESQGRPAVWTVSGWTWYPKLTATTFGAAATILMLAGVVLGVRATLKNKKGLGPRWASAPSVVAGWLVFSLAAWSMVPNKDFRYFLPGMVALPALGFAALPEPLLAAAAVLALAQIPSLPAPQSQAWPLSDILKTVEERRDPGSQTATLCVLPNHVDMNATNLLWLTRRMGLADIRIRGRRTGHPRNLEASANPGVAIGGQQSEIPEWSDFVLYKTGNPGPFLSDKTIAIMAQIGEEGGFFRKIFREARRWPLPDGSEAVLFEVRPDLAVLKRPLHLAELKVRSARLSDVDITVAGSGRYVVKVGELRLEKLDAPVRDIRVELEGARLIEHEGRPYVIGVRKVRLLSARVAWDDLSRALSARAHLPIHFESTGQGLSARADLGPLVIHLALTAQSIRDGVLVRDMSAQVGGIPVPFLGSVLWRQGLGARLPYQPYDLELGDFTFGKSELALESASMAAGRGR